jgi:hypothetical protein
MMYALVVIIHLMDLPHPISLQVGTESGGPFSFDSVSECQNHVSENLMALQIWTTTVVPRETTIEKAQFFCFPQSEIILDPDVSSDTPSTET